MGWSNKRLLETRRFRAWLDLEICRRNGTLLRVEDWAEKQMNENNLKIEMLWE